MTKRVIQLVHSLKASNDRINVFCIHDLSPTVLQVNLWSSCYNTWRVYSSKHDLTLPLQAKTGFNVYCVSENVERFIVSQ